MKSVCSHLKKKHSKKIGKHIKPGRALFKLIEKYNFQIPVSEIIKGQKFKTEYRIYRT